MNKLTVALLGGLALSAVGGTLAKQYVAKPVSSPLAVRTAKLTPPAMKQPTANTPGAKPKTMRGCDIILWGQPAKYGSGVLLCGFLNGVCARIKCTASPVIYAVSVYKGDESETPALSFNASSEYGEQDTEDGTQFSFTEVEEQP